jgi:hypothetical protein
MFERQDDTLGQLRKVMDGNDSFMQGHQIYKIRRIKKSVPDWARSNKEVQKILLRSFPKLADDVRQRNRAATWALVIHMYFRVNCTHREISKQIKKPISSVKSTIRAIKRAAIGLRANGSGSRGLTPGGNKQGWPRGKPRKAKV